MSYHKGNNPHNHHPGQQLEHYRCPKGPLCPFSCVSFIMYTVLNVLSTPHCISWRSLRNSVQRSFTFFINLHSCPSCRWSTGYSTSLLMDIRVVSIFFHYKEPCNEQPWACILLLPLYLWVRFLAVRVLGQEKNTPVILTDTAKFSLHWTYTFCIPTVTYENILVLIAFSVKMLLTFCIFVYLVDEKSCLRVV